MSEVSSVDSSSAITSLYNTSGNDLGKEEFLKLFIAQLNNQDPLDPMDNTEFISQLSQFSQLEQLWNLNDAMEANADLTQSVNNTLMTNMIGKGITVESNTLEYSDGDIPDIQYVMPSSGEVAFQVLDEDGDVIFQSDMGSQAAGLQAIEWDGKDGSGNEIVSGTYYFNVIHSDSLGQQTVLTTYLAGKVSGLQYQDGQPVLYIGNQAIDASSIVSIYEFSEEE